MSRVYTYGVVGMALTTTRGDRHAVASSGRRWVCYVVERRRSAALWIRVFPGYVREGDAVHFVATGRLP